MYSIFPLLACVWYSVVIRSTAEEQEEQIARIQRLHATSPDEAHQQLNDLRAIAIQNDNLFEGFMQAVKVCSLGQIANAMYEVGGQYRRNM